MSEAPPFWFRRPGLFAWGLSPFSAIYGRMAARRMAAAPRAVSRVPVLCIGNFVVGGAGKTPTAIALARVARDLGIRPGFLSRGYGGSIREATRVDDKSHNARDVGDEPLILARYGVTVVSADRAAGAAMLQSEGVDLIIMDDGFQNPFLHKDYSLVVIDANRGIGNGYCIPAGPVRAPLSTQLAQASAILLIGNSGAGMQLVRTAARAAKPVLTGSMQVRRRAGWNGMQALAYAGIAVPAKFYASLEALGVEVVERQSFHDHHPFSAEECQDLIARADRAGLSLVTTEKDAARLARMGQYQEALRAKSRVLLIDMEFENRKMGEMVVRETIRRAEAFRLQVAPTI